MLGLFSNLGDSEVMQMQFKLLSDKLAVLDVTTRWDLSLNKNVFVPIMKKM